jgi:hypothetical protein
MLRINPTFVLLIIVTLLFSVQTANVLGQSSPALSPWLSLFNNNRNGVLDNYNEFVKPRQEMLRSLQDQGNQIRQMESQPSSMQGSANQQLLNDGSTGRILDEPRRVKSIGGMNGAGYRQYLHWYQGGMPHGGVPNFSQPGGRRR